MVEKMCYIGREPCGCVVASTMDTGQERSGVAGAVAEFIKDGLIVERVSVDYVREHFCTDGCPHKPRQLRLEVLEGKDE